MFKCSGGATHKLVWALPAQIFSFCLSNLIPPPPTIINLCWFCGRLKWLYILYFVVLNSFHMLCNRAVIFVHLLQLWWHLRWSRNHYVLKYLLLDSSLILLMTTTIVRKLSAIIKNELWNRMRLIVKWLFSYLYIEFFFWVNHAIFLLLKLKCFYWDWKWENHAIFPIQLWCIFLL